MLDDFKAALDRIVARSAHVPPIDLADALVRKADAVLRSAGADYVAPTIMLVTDDNAGNWLVTTSDDFGHAVPKPLFGDVFAVTSAAIGQPYPFEDNIDGVAKGVRPKPEPAAAPVPAEAAKPATAPQPKPETYVMSDGFKMTPVASSNLAAVGYNPETAELRVAFKNGTTYSYGGVTQEDALAMLKAKSIGKHFMTVLKPKYPGVLIPVPDPITAKVGEDKQADNIITRAVVADDPKAGGKALRVVTADGVMHTVSMELADGAGFSDFNATVGKPYPFDDVDGVAVAFKPPA